MQIIIKQFIFHLRKIIAERYSIPIFKRAVIKHLSYWFLYVQYNNSKLNAHAHLFR